MSREQEELLLAEMIASAISTGMEWCSYEFFVDASGYPTTLGNYSRPPVACCGLGALMLSDSYEFGKLDGDGVVFGNDSVDTYWGESRGDLWDSAESIGNAFKVAMTQED